MKVTIDIDCTPEEARRFLGLPDVAAMQEKMVEELQKKMAENIRNMDPDSMMKTWFPAGMPGMEEMQKTFWEQMNRIMGTPAGTPSGKKNA